MGIPKILQNGTAWTMVQHGTEWYSMVQNSTKQHIKWYNPSLFVQVFIKCLDTLRTLNLRKNKTYSHETYFAEWWLWCSWWNTHPFWLTKIWLKTYILCIHKVQNRLLGLNHDNFIFGLDLGHNTTYLGIDNLRPSYKPVFVGRKQFQGDIYTAMLSHGHKCRNSCMWNHLDPEKCPHPLDNWLCENFY